MLPIYQAQVGQRRCHLHLTPCNQKDSTNIGSRKTLSYLHLYLALSGVSYASFLEAKEVIPLKLI